MDLGLRRLLRSASRASLAPLGALVLAASAHAGPTATWVADLDAVRAAFPGGPPIETVEDLFRVRVKMAGGTELADVLLFGDRVQVLPYHDDDAVVDASGAPVARGDGVLAETFPPGEVGFAIKHHRIAHRELEVPFRSSYLLREELKLHDSHLQIVVGVVRDGSPGVVTLSSPPGYENGRFGTATYPMVFLRPRYPDYLDDAQVAAFRDNIRTMSVGFGSVAKLPVDYSGGDPVSAADPAAVLEEAAWMVRAIGGDAEARRRFTDPAHKLYCGELGLLVASAGLLAPLNAATFVPLVGEDAWRRFELQVAAHGRGEESGFTLSEESRPARYIGLVLAPPELRPAPSYAPPARRDTEATLLAFRPMTLIDMIEQFVRLVLPRERLGEQRGAALQGEMLAAIQPMLVQLLALDRIPPKDPRRSDRAAVDVAWARLAEIVSRPHTDAEAMRRELRPTLDELRELATRLVPAGTNFSAPPSLFHLTALHTWGGGLLELEYAGHGLHYSLVRRAGS